MEDKVKEIREKWLAPGKAISINPQTTQAILDDLKYMVNPIECMTEMDEAKYTRIVIDDSSMLEQEFPTIITSETDAYGKQRLSIKQGSSVVMLSIKMCRKILPLAERWKVE